jgi:aspartate/methionine/tyrosine aminotransferase
VSSVLTWGPGRVAHARASSRLQAVQASPHAMWNYVTYRDAIGILGLDPDEIYPAGATRLDPAQWVDLGWLTCFAGPPESAVTAMRDAVSADALNQYPPDLLEPLRDEAARFLGAARGPDLEVIGTVGAQEGISLSLMAAVDPGDEVLVSDPGYFHVPSAVLAVGGVPVGVPISRANDYRLDPDAVAARITRRTRAMVIIDPMNPYGTVATRGELEHLAALADHHGFLLIHDVTHGALGIDPGAKLYPLPSLGITDNATATFSVSHCWGMAGARVGFLAGPPDLMRGCLQLKAALTRLNTNLVSQVAARAALGDPDYLDRAAGVVRTNLAHLERSLDACEGLRLVVRPQRGLACAVDTSGAGVSAQELLVALFARKVAVYPGDGLGESTAQTMIRINLSRPDAHAMEHLRAVLPEAVAEARSGRWRDAVIELLERKGTARGARLADLLRAQQ